jgi:hypothetical protein
MPVIKVPSALYRKVAEINDLILHVAAGGDISMGNINALTNALKARCFSMLRNREETKKVALRMNESGISRLNDPERLGEGDYPVIAKVFADFKALRFRIEVFLLIQPKDTSDEDEEEYRLFMTIFSFQNQNVAVATKKFTGTVPIEKSGSSDDTTFFPRRTNHAAHTL